MNEISFETALGRRVDHMLDACTRCGKCVEVCPSVGPVGISETNPKDVISGVLDIVRTGLGPEASRKWAASCMLSGECIKACDYGVNPRNPRDPMKLWIGIVAALLIETQAHAQTDTTSAKMYSRARGDELRADQVPA